MSPNQFAGVSAVMPTLFVLKLGLLAAPVRSVPVPVLFGSVRFCSALFDFVLFLLCLNRCLVPLFYLFIYY